MTTSQHAFSWWRYLLLGHIEPFRGDVQFEDPENAERSFASHYQTHIQPFVEQFEAKRIEALKSMRKRILIAVPLGFVLTLVGLFIINIFALLIPVGLGAWAWWPCHTYKQSVKEDIFRNVFSFFGDDYTYMPDGGVPAHYFQPSGILPKYDSAHIEDGIVGSHKGVKIEMVEAHLKDRRQTTNSDGKTSTKYVTVFKGMLIALSMNKPFQGHTVIRQDNGAICNWLNKSSRLETVRLEDPVFEKAFEVYSSDQVEARYLITTSFMERLLNLKQLMVDDKSFSLLSFLGGVLKGWNSGTINGLQASFYEEKLLLMIPSNKNRFEISSMLYPATFEQDINAILKEMSTIFQIIELLKLDQNTRL